MKRGNVEDAVKYMNQARGISTIWVFSWSVAVLVCGCEMFIRHHWECIRFVCGAHCARTGRNIG